MPTLRSMASGCSMVVSARSSTCSAYAGAMAPSPTYTEYLPPRDLAPWVACFWRIVGHSIDVRHRVLPDGCADLLFDLEGARGPGGASTDLIGPMSTAHVVELSGAVDLFGVRLRP